MAKHISNPDLGAVLKRGSDICLRRLLTENPFIPIRNAVRTAGLRSLKVTFKNVVERSFLFFSYEFWIRDAFHAKGAGYDTRLGQPSLSMNGFFCKKKWGTLVLHVHW